MNAKDLEFEIVHFGINCEDENEAMNCAEIFSTLFEIDAIKNGKDSIFASGLAEIMKGNGRGAKGHIGIGCNDINSAIEHLKSKGIEFDDSSSKLDENGNLFVIYMKLEIAGFAVHLLQK